MNEKRKDWRALAARAAQETDSAKLRELIEELNEVLDKNEKESHGNVTLESDQVANSAGAATSRRLLFVDDEPSIRLTLPAILQNNGFDVRVAASVTEALVEIGQQEFDVLLSDLNIGSERDGFDVVKAMRQAHPRCVTILLTGYPAFETAVEGIRHQIDDYVVKPADIELLIRMMNEKLLERQKSTV